MIHTILLSMQWYFLFQVMFFESWGLYKLALLYNVKKEVGRLYNELKYENNSENRKEDSQMKEFTEGRLNKEQKIQEEISRKAWIQTQKKLYPYLYPEGVDLSMTYEERIRKEKIAKEVEQHVSVLLERQRIENNQAEKRGEKMSQQEKLEWIQNCLNQLVGLDEVKLSVKELIDLIEVNRLRREQGLSETKPMLHMIFTGNPGTGKTTVARIIAEVFKTLNVVSKGHLVEVTREDLVEGYIGQTAAKTKKVLQEASGGILFIDEAYTLSRGGDQDFGKEAIDTIVKHMEDHRDDLIIILAGYTKEMTEFMRANSGLASRFPFQIKFADYSTDELLTILKRELRKRQYTISKETEKALLNHLETKSIKGRSDNGNGRMVRNMVEKAIRRQSSRLRKEMDYLSKERLSELTTGDFNIQQESVFNLEKTLAGIIGNEKLKEKIRMIAAQMNIQKLRKEQGFKVTASSQHMIFQGNPGTGKTMIARTMAKLLMELGVLKKGHLVEVTREDLVAGYIGQTASKTREVVESALGGVLFIDEAYTLSTGGENDFGREAINTLVKMMEDHRDELVIILAGSRKEMTDFFQANSGLNSRFPIKLDFEDYSPLEMTQILELLAIKKGYKIQLDTLNKLYQYLKVHPRDEQSGNGRFSRNVLEEAIQYQAYRLSKLDRAPSREELMTLNDEDFPILSSQSTCSQLQIR
ncbi:AAA family ATPase [Pseudobacillus sp. 179-B 2D1 NHS]|uniref:AAA family ATPase n=1 Tax=Pseudobacillus sp. 179-B 2D1 NHS TaxID=3374292 RepID=UPI003879A784